MRRILSGAFLIVLMLSSPAHPADAPSLAERLGFSPTDKIVIIHADDTALSYSTNKAVIDGMERGLVASGSVMVPCAWFPHIANYARSNPRADFGIHITLTSEWEGYRWGPLAEERADLRGLTDDLGYFRPTVDEFREHATPEMAQIEAREQILTARAAGMDITHLDSHMWAMHLNPEYMEAFLRLAREFDLPVRMPIQSFLESAGLGPLRRQLADEGILCPDFLVWNAESMNKGSWERILASLQPGVTEILIHPALPSREMQAITGDRDPSNWRVRAAEYETFVEEPEIREVIQARQIKRIGYRSLRDLQHRERNAKVKWNSDHHEMSRGPNHGPLPRQKGVSLSFRSGSRSMGRLP
jgi:chitin disaccharide deacetylase